MSEIRDRLRWALEEHADLSIREFQRRMDGRGVRGSSYASVHGYLRGEAVPSVEFLREAAVVLGVREVWLILGRGAPTGPDGGGAERTREARPGPGARLRARVLDRHPFLAGLRRGERDLFFEVLGRYVVTAPDAGGAAGREGAAEEVVELAGDLAFLLAMPVGRRAWGFREPEDDRERFHDFVVAMLHALSLLMERRGDGAPVARAADSRIRRLRELAAAGEEGDGSGGEGDAPAPGPAEAGP